MAYHPDSTATQMLAGSLADVLPESFLESLSEGGLSGLPEAIRLLINAAMLAERQKHLSAEPYQRTSDRQGYANGFKDKTVATRMGAITFSVPQVRDGRFYPSALEKGLRSERALKLALAEMYVCGVSTRKVARITEELCGFEVSSTAVSRAASELDEALSAWRSRPLGECHYLYLDARYEKVRQEGRVRDVAVLLASGVGPDGKRSVLGVSVSLSEHEVHWRNFLTSLVERGLRGVRLIVSDDHCGLKAARKAVFGGIPWQRCQFHLQQNASAYVPRQEMKQEVAADIRTIFNSRDKQEAQTRLKETIEKYTQSASRLAGWMEQAIPEGLTCFDFPTAHQRRIRTSNSLERLSQEIKRRTRVVRLFPGEASCLRLVTAVLMEISEEWETERAYITFSAA